MDGNGDFSGQLAMRSVSLFQINLHQVLIDDQILDDHSQDLSLHLVHALGRQIDAIVLQDEAQPVLRGGATAFSRSPEQTAQ